MNRDILVRILDLARWAPSGDNTQPWRFEILGEERIAIHGSDTRTWCVYDFDGHASHMAHGALLETLRIAATAFGLEATWQLRAGGAGTAPIYDVFVGAKPGIEVDPLFPYIETRTVQRRPMGTAPLTDVQRSALISAPGMGYELQFFESLGARLKLGRLLWNNAYLRLTCPEAFEVHREIIEWGARYSKDRIPEQAVGVDPLTAKLMKWVMRRWERVDFFNRYLLGTVAPRIQLDFIPALACSAHILLKRDSPLRGLEDYVRAGVAMQRLWLTAAAAGLYLQPEMTPLIFRWYARAGRSISVLPEIDRGAARLADQLESLAGQEGGGYAFLCRVGISKAPSSRSIRMDLKDLMLSRN